MKSTLIRVEPVANGHRVHLYVESDAVDWTSPAHAVCSADLPPVPDKAAIEQMRRIVLEEPGASPKFMTIGRTLHDLLLDNAVGQALGQALAPGEATRVLIDPGTDDLRKLPWELMRAADLGTPFTSRVHVFARAAARIDVTPGDPGACWPLRVLVVQGTDEPEVRAAYETDRVHDAFRRLQGLIDIEVLERPTIAEVKAEYARRPPHVLHFVGHGGSDHLSGFLVLDPSDGSGPVPLRPDVIRTMLEGTPPKLVVLNACQTADMAENEGARSVAEAFATLGAGAVLATQGQVEGDPAALFAAQLFETLARGAPIDQAVAEARAQVMAAKPNDLREWALATLQVSRLPESVIDLRKGNPRGFLAPEPFTHVRYYVNRTRHRRVLWGQIAPKRVSSAVAVTGETKAGKSALLKWSLGLRALHGDNVAYVDLARANRLATRQVLEEIARALETAPTPFAPGNATAMNAFRAKAATLPEKLEDWNDLFKPFIDALAAAAGDGNLLIALDHLRGAEGWQFQAHVGDLLLLPLVKGLPMSIRVVLALHASEQLTMLSSDLGAKLETVALEPLKGKHFRRVATQFLRALRYRQEEIEGMVAWAEGRVGPTWTATKFEWLAKTAEDFDLAREEDV